MFNAQEKRGVFSIAAIYGLRMLGLFLILPVFAIYAEHLDGATPALVGLALGAYGLTMAVLQIPFGWASDRIGRKPVIAAGLLIFAAGSVLAAMADTIEGVIAGRALQGAGAIAAALTALLADLTREDVRLRAMAVIGMTIGFSFTLALIVAPWLDAAIGVPGIFWLTAALSLLAVAALFTVVPDPVRSRRHRDAEAVPGQFGRILRDGQLLRLDAGILILHGVMTAVFVALPLVLRDNLHIDPVHHAWVYLPVLLVAMAVMVPLIIMAEARGRMRQVFLLSIGGIALAMGLLAIAHAGMATVIGGLFLFFVFYNVLEATLPSLLSRMAPVDAKGTAMGVYSTAQFLGAFLGGWLGGLAHGGYGVTGVFAACAGAMALWFVLALGQRMPAMLSTHMAHVDGRLVEDAADLERRLLDLPGVREARVAPEEDAVFLRVEKKAFDPDALVRVLPGRQGSGE
ncbi:MAG: MFS transporter [Mariprofundaceae bacterium]